ncbi:hypothetical protein AYO44_06330 [Planctomycetaceae bacterium SCGC AG-212-F19]|nr:hypothetical protein AYO44_06330 [Planctomycetaceae bacterium SCGC AG-212-F19]
MRGDQNIIKLSESFVRLRITYLRDQDIGLFAYDYDQTWMSFFLDADARIYCRYGSRDATSADSHNSATGLLATMRRVLALHQEESAKEKPEHKLPPPVRPGDLPGIRALNYGGSCIRCHMVNEAFLAQKRKEGKLDVWFYPPPDNIGLQLDKIEGDLVRAVTPESLADNAGLKAGDRIRHANGSRVLTHADLQFVLNGLENKSKLTLEVERDGKPVTADLELDGDWRRSDVTWRKSVRIMTYRALPVAGALAPLPAADRMKHQIAEGDLALRVIYVTPPIQQLGFRQNDVIVAFDGKRQPPAYKVPQLFFYLDHKSGDKVEVTLLRDGKEEMLTLTLP